MAIVPRTGASPKRWRLLNVRVELGCRSHTAGPWHLHGVVIDGCGHCMSLPRVDSRACRNCTAGTPPGGRAQGWVRDQRRERTSWAMHVGFGPAEGWGFAVRWKGRTYHCRMSKLLCGLRRRAALVDVAIAVLFVVLDTVVTLVGWSWWPAQPDALAWTLLAAQGLTDLSLVARRRAPIAVVGIFTAFTLAVTLLISPACTATCQSRQHLGPARRGRGLLRAGVPGRQLPPRHRGLRGDRGVGDDHGTALAAIGDGHHHRPSCSACWSPSTS